MPLLSSGKPVSHLQRRANWSVLILCIVLGVALGWWNAKDCAATYSGYLASYSYVFASAALIGLCVIGLLLLIYWRTRWLGFGLIAAGILSCAMFYGGMKVLLREDRVAWVHEQMVRRDLDTKASAVIYFRIGTTPQEREDFDSLVLQEPAAPRHAGRDYPAFVQLYWALGPDQANGHDAVALTFFGNAPVGQVNAYLAKIRADSRVERIFLEAAPSSIHIESQKP
jgi:hypothetical protein